MYNVYWRDLDKKLCKMAVDDVADEQYAIFAVTEHLFMSQELYLMTVVPSKKKKTFDQPLDKEWA